ncbi:MAG: CDP-diacylglycerol--glycerol-3-phosphate 3-phosphatidyltransferase, partial [Candidatus Aenigmatarchaeota archaeon]
ALIPVIIALVYIEGEWAKWLAFSLFVFAVFTDWIDGKIARKLNQKTKFGSFWDPLSDKLMINLVLLVFMDIGLLPAWMVLLNLARELAVHETRKMAMSEGLILVSEQSGKAKAGFQMLTIFTGLLLLGMAASAIMTEVTAYTTEILFWIMAVTLVVAYYAVVEFFWKNRKYIFRR